MANKQQPSGNTSQGSPQPAEGTLPSGGAMPAAVIATSDKEATEDKSAVLAAPGADADKAAELEQQAAADREQQQEMAKRAQDGVTVKPGEEVFKHGDTPAPAPSQDQALETKPVKATAALPPEPSPGRTVPVEGEGR